MAATNYSPTTLMRELDKMSRAAVRANLGQALFAVINAHNDLAAKHNDLVTKYDALLAHLDAANVTGIGNGNTAAYGAAADINLADAQVGLPGTYPSPLG